MSQLLIVGDRVLIRPQEGEQKTAAGLVLPASVAKQEKVRGGLVVKTGPGYLMPNPEYSEGEAWKAANAAVRYLPLQAEPGDYAFFLQDKGVEITYQDQSYVIVPHAAILALVRPDPDDDVDPIDQLLDSL